MQAVKTTTSPSRMMQYDLIRVVAMVFVVAVHALVVIDTSTAKGAYYLFMGQSVFFTANSLFFLLSGRFNLTDRVADNPTQFYIKRIKTILLPIIIIFLIRTGYDLWSQQPSLWDFTKRFIRNSAGDFGSIEYWFIFSLVGYLLAAPFLARAFAHLPRVHMRWLVGIGFLWTTVLYVSRAIGVRFAWGFPFGGFLFVFLCGSFIEKLFSKRSVRFILLALACICIVPSSWLAVHGYSEGLFDESPLHLIIACGFFLGLVELGSALQEKTPHGVSATLSSVLGFISKHSFTVYLVHMMFLMPFANMVPHIGYLNSVSHLMLTGATVAASLVCAVILNVLLIRPAQRLYDYAVKHMSCVTRNEQA